MSMARNVWLVRDGLPADAHAAADIGRHGGSPALRMISTIMPSPLPLYPPSGISSSSRCAAALVVGCRRHLSAQPVEWFRCPFTIFSDAIGGDGGGGYVQQAGGAAMQMGLVPMRPCLPCHGRERGDALQEHYADHAVVAILRLPPPRRSGSRLARYHHAGRADGLVMRTAWRRLPEIYLAHSVLPVGEEQG